uniref:Ubiquitin-like protease family profile domain-containing protein n=1 Tax=Arundo donax TaxID=35708 RepID=A0A0A9EY82_ARUDO
MKENTFQYLDSLGGMDSNVSRVLAQYIAEEVKDKSNKVIDTSSWHEELVDYIPLQQNGWDCGMFMLKYIDFHSRGLSLSFSQEHMGYFRKRTAKEILRLRAD